MDSARIRLEGRLEQVEAAVAAVKSARRSLCRASPAALADLPRVLSTFEEHLPEVRRHRESREVQAALRALRLESEGLVADCSRIAQSIGVPMPTSVHEACRVLTPHLPVKMNGRVIGKPLGLAA